MKNEIFLDTGIISLYQSKDENIFSEITKIRKESINFISSELNYIELFKHICKEKGKITAQIVMENLRNSKIVKFIPVFDKISLLAGELKCTNPNLSLVDSVVCAEALTRNIFVYTTETRFIDVKRLKVKTFDY
jgi:hypothetical protein